MSGGGRWSFWIALVAGVTSVTCGKSVHTTPGQPIAGTGGREGTAGSGGTNGLAGGGGSIDAAGTGNSAGTGSDAGTGNEAGTGGESGSPTGGTGGSAGTLNVPVVDPAVSAEYRWEECGRIPAAAAPLRQALYGAGSSVLSLDELGGIRAYAPGSLSPIALVEAPSPPERADVGMSLSVDRKQLVRWQGAIVEVYAGQDGGPIGVDSGKLSRVIQIDRSSTVCDGKVVFSWDATLLVGQGVDTICWWDVASGELSTISLPTASSETPLVGVAEGSTPVRALHGETLFNYMFSRGLVNEIDLTALLPAGRAHMTALSPDAETLLILVSPGTMGTPLDLVALHSAGGSERWRTSVSNPNVSSLWMSSDGYAVVEREGVFRLDNGAMTARDTAFYPNRGMDVHAERQMKLVLGELVDEWDLMNGTVSKLYGSHERQVTALEVSRDGRYFASHGDTAVMWELDAEFASSRPLAQGRAGDVSWNVAVAPDGGAMVASGDNVVYVDRSGRSQPPNTPPPPEIGCFSPDWAFSPLGDLVAGVNYGGGVQIRNGSDFSLIDGLATNNCAGGVAFSPDGAFLVTASLELFETATWTNLWNRSSQQQAPPLPVSFAEHAVEFSPDAREIALTRCTDDGLITCRSRRHAALDGATLGAIPSLVGDRVRYSPEGHWLVSENRALHLPSETLVEYASAAKVSAFTPDGDIIAGMTDGALVRYCRTGD
jgi:WD40 repeat protein